MEMVELSEEILEKLEQIEGKAFTEKIINLLKQRILLQLRECDEYILKYETKYGLDFEQFKSAWESDQIENKRSHEVERDLME